MTDAMTLGELAARIEAAEGPDRELDCLITVAVDGGEIVWKQANGTMDMFPARRYASANHVGGFGHAPVPTYTASVDAALMLVPEGWSMAILREFGEPAQVALQKTDGTGYAYVLGNSQELASAICAAALRAKEVSDHG